MEDKTAIQIARLTCGTVMLVIHALTGINGNLVSSAMFLIGVPFEYLRKSKTEDKK